MWGPPPSPHARLFGQWSGVGVSLLGHFYVLSGRGAIRRLGGENIYEKDSSSSPNRAFSLHPLMVSGIMSFIQQIQIVSTPCQVLCWVDTEVTNPIRPLPSS